MPIHTHYKGSRDSKTVGPCSQTTGVTALKRISKTGEQITKARSCEVFQARNKAPIGHRLEVFAQSRGSTRMYLFEATASEYIKSPTW